MKTLIQQLITINSISGQEQTISDFAFSWLKEEAQIKAIKIGNGNIVLCIEGRNRNQALIFNAHLDTVGPGNISDWEYQPYGLGSGVIKNGKVYGLGASDEKSGVVVLMFLLKKLIKKKPPVDIWLTFVVNEEIDGAGTKNVMKYFDKQGMFKQYKSIAGIICEPTGLSEIQIAHKGNVFIKLAVRGDAGHGSEPEKIKLQAIKSLMEAIDKVEKLGEKWSKIYHDKLLGKPTMSLTSFQAGDVNCPNSFPSLAEATFDIRTIPQMHQLVMKSIKKIIEKTGAEVSNVGEPAPAGYTDRNDPLVKASKLVCPKAKITVTNGSTDQCFFSQRSIPAIIFGSGEDELAHKPNEFCYLNKIGSCVGIYNKLITRWANCKVSDTLQLKMKHNNGSPVQAVAII